MALYEAIVALNCLLTLLIIEAGLPVGLRVMCGNVLSLPTTQETRAC